MTNPITEMLKRENLVRIPQMGDYPPEQAAQVAKDCALLALDHKTIIRISHQYGCTTRQAIRVIDAQQSYAALHDLLIELANDNRQRA